MDDEIRKIHAVIAYTGIRKRDLARHLGLTKYTFSEMLHGDRKFPEPLKEKLKTRLMVEFQRIEEEEQQLEGATQ